MKTLNYALIGCGMMGREHIRNILLLQNTRIAAVYEPDEEMREAAGKLVPEAVFTDSIEELLAVPEIDALVVVSPNFTHVDVLKKIENLHPLPVLIEKPLFTEPADSEFITTLMSNFPCPLWVAMEYRYMPPLAEFINRVEKVTGGVSMFTIREHRFPFLAKVNDWNRFNRYSGGTLVEKCCHYFDLMRFVLNSEPARVMASAGQAHNHTDENYAGEAPDIWDHGYVIIEFKNGARAMLELCMFAEGSQFQEEITAVGCDGKLECLIPGPSRFWPDHLGDEPVPKIIVSPRSPKGPQVIEVPVDPTLLEAGDHHGSTFYQHKQFQQVLLGSHEPEVTLHDGWAAVMMGMAAQESARTGEAVNLDW